MCQYTVQYAGDAKHESNQRTVGRKRSGCNATHLLGDLQYRRRYRLSDIVTPDFLLQLNAGLVFSLTTERVYLDFAGSDGRRRFLVGFHGDSL